MTGLLTTTGATTGLTTTGAGATRTGIGATAGAATILTDFPDLAASPAPAPRPDPDPNPFTSPAAMAFLRSAPRKTATLWVGCLKENRTGRSLSAAGAAAARDRRAETRKVFEIMLLAWQFSPDSPC